MLIMSLLLLASGIAGGLAIAILVISEVRQSSAIDSGLVSYFSAESGLEESIYDIRQKDICGNLTNCQNTDYQNCDLPNINNTSLCSTSSNINIGCAPVDCNKQIQPTKILPVGTLGMNDTFQIDIDPSMDAALRGFRFFWKKPTSEPEPLLEVSYVVINTTNSNTEVVRPNLNMPYKCKAADLESVDCESIINSVDNNELPFSQSNLQLYQLRLKALRNNIPELTVGVLPEDAELSNYLDVRSKGEYSNIQQILRTQIPRNLPVVGLPDYVIFSEETIIK